MHSAAGVATAVDFYDWAAPLDGSFEQPVNWELNGAPAPNAPTVGDVARFAVPGSYVVTIPAVIPTQSDVLQVTSGTVTFKEQTIGGGRVVLTTGQADAVISGGATLILGVPNDRATLDIGDRLTVDDEGTLNVFHGSDVNVDADIEIGNLSSAAFSGGEVYVSGSGSTINAPTGLTTIGGLAKSNTLTFDNSAGGSLATTSGGVQVADSNNDSAAGELHVVGGASINTGDVAVATRGSGAAGAITVSGAGSAITQTRAGSALTLGSASGGSATLNVNLGGSFTTGTGDSTVGATGVINVFAGRFHTEGDLTIDGGQFLRTEGGSGLGADSPLGPGAVLTIQNNALFEWGGLGADLLLEDAEAVVTSGANLRHTSAAFERNTLGVSGAALTATLAGTIEFPYLNLASGSVTVNGAGSTLTAAGWPMTDGKHRIGVLGSALLEVRDTATASFAGADNGPIELGGVAAGVAGDIVVELGGELTTRSISARAGGGSITVDGAGSLLTMVGDSTLDVGTPGGDPMTVTLSNDGQLVTGTGLTTIHASGLVDVGGPSANASLDSFQANGNVLIDGGTLRGDLFKFRLVGGGSLTATNGALIQSLRHQIDADHIYTIRNGADMLIENGLSVGTGGGGSGGLLLIDDPGSSLALTNPLGNSLSIAANGRVGRVSVSDQATASAADLVIAQATDSVDGTNGVLLLQSGAHFTASGNVDVGTKTSPANGSATGAITVSGAGSTFLHTGDAQSRFRIGDEGAIGIVELLGGHLEVQHATIELSPTGTIHLTIGKLRAAAIDHTLGGVFNFTAGTLSTDLFMGTLVQDGGFLAPGDSAGLTRITGDYELDAGAVAIEIGGPVPGDEFDRVAVDGTAFLRPNVGVQVSLIDGFLPTLGETFEVLSAGARDGEFAFVQSPLFDNKVFSVFHDAAGATLAVVPFLTGDYNADGVVDAADYTVWRDSEGQNGVGLAADGNRDRVVNQADYDLWAANFGYDGSSTSESIPEPTTISLLVVAGLETRRWRRSTHSTC